MSIDINAQIQALPERVNADANLQRIGRYCSVEFLLQCGDHSFYLSVDRGRLAPVLEGARRMRSWRFALRAAPESWQRFWEPVPAVGYNDIFAMSRHGHLAIEGDVGPLLEHLRYLKAVLALPRHLRAQANA